MKENHRERNRSGDGNPSCPVPVPLRDYMETVKKQVEMDSFARRDRQLVSEMCAIVAEIYCLAAGAEGTVRIEGVAVPYSLIRDVYEYLTAEHLEYVMERYRGVHYPIRNIKAYLRSALYNAVYELELGRENEFRQDF